MYLIYKEEARDRLVDPLATSVLLNGANSCSYIGEI
jgi:hypothetical protein